MTSSVPSGDAAVTSASEDSAFDENAAPSAGPDPDTAVDAAGERDVSAAPDVAPPEQAPPTDATSTPTELTGPALENDEMRLATDDLRSSRDKSAQAREIVQDLVDKTQPGD